MARARVTHLLSLRFVLIVLHVVAVFAVSHDRFFSITQTLRDEVPRGRTIEESMDDLLVKYTQLNSRFKWYLSGMFASTGIELWGMFLGHCVFHNGLNLASILFHAWGVLFTLWMAAEAWTIESFTWIWVAFSLLPAIFASGYIVDHVFYKSTLVRRLDINI